MFVTPLSVAILIIMLFNLTQTVEHLSQALIKRTTERTTQELKDFYDPVIRNLLVNKERGASNIFKSLHPKELNPIFIPLLSNYPQISSMMIGNTAGNEYMLLRLDTFWANRNTKNFNGLKNITRYEYRFEDSKLKLIKKWAEKKDYDPTVRPWFVEAIKNKSEDHPAWTDPYIFFTTKDPGITTSIKWFSTKDSLEYVIAFDILLLDLSKFTSNLHVSKNGKAFILTPDEKIMGLPPEPWLTEVDSLKKYVLSDVNQLNDQPIRKAISRWKEKYGGKEALFKFKIKGKDWWTGVSEYEISPGKTLLIVVVVPEDDFLAEVNRTRIVIICGFILVLALTILVIRGYNQKQKAYAKLAEQKIQIEKQRDEISKQRDQIEEQQAEIKASIKYSQRIQGAVLPPQCIIDQCLEENFVLYLPRDIVSGDFYWIHQKEKMVLFAAVDCTGHGVPGAFMSIIGHNGLNRTVREYGLSQPGQILDKLNYIVAETFRQTGSEIIDDKKYIKDGMDMALCKLHKSKNLLEYAGANNPLYLVRKKEKSLVVDHETKEPVIDSETHNLFELKATKLPIGSFDQAKKFVNHDIELQKGDIVYIFSDGFADQFGGPKGKKFMYKPMKKLLLNICEKPMETQKQLLLQAFSEWKKETEQIDDVIIFGVKIT